MSISPSAQAYANAIHSAEGCLVNGLHQAAISFTSSLIAEEMGRSPGGELVTPIVLGAAAATLVNTNSKTFNVAVGIGVAGTLVARRLSRENTKAHQRETLNLLRTGNFRNIADVRTFRKDAEGFLEGLGSEERDIFLPKYRDFLKTLKLPKADSSWAGKQFTRQYHIGDSRMQETQKKVWHALQKTFLPGRGPVSLNEQKRQREEDFRAFMGLELESPRNAAT